ncbi:hypothetical protein LL240_16860 [Oceanimonas baumannii]|uniref:hypothetical protein n=1 Tax=Oceanimonas baumannii TaxID=129578 RepID=UPI001D191555|nr:hypothetical protein [Oceanimonas baumannii]MCC4266108.1 hypothetical protein [Oceanimonas baumannii]
MTRNEAEALRQACLDAALNAYEEGGLLGLCQQGRFELAMDAIDRLDLIPFVEPGSTSPGANPQDESSL